MRSLFLRIFLTFWAATALIGGCIVVLALTTDSRRAEFARHEKRLTQLGREMVAAYQTGGVGALEGFERPRNSRGDPAAFLFRGAEGPLSGLRAPRPAPRLAARAAATGEREVRPGRHGLWLALPLEEPYVLVTQVTPPTPLERLFDPYRLTSRLGVAFLITGLVSYLLARSLSAPIRRLREATQGLAAGDLSVRVGPTGARSRDEIGDLGRDFDRMAERIESVMGAQTRLLRDISHELRSPLARLNVALELVRRQLGSEQGAGLDRIEREAERLNELIGQLLTLTVLESGAEKTDQIKVDLAALVREIATDADFEARNRNRTVQVFECPQVTVQGAPELLRRAVENVIRNGVRFTAEGSAVEVNLTTRTDADGVRACLRVRDHGPGVPKSVLTDLFRPFYRVAEARDRGSGGTGIGLAITERAVQLHGGTVSVSNAPDGGLAVVIELPAIEG